MPITQAKLSVDGTRKEIRNQVIMKFLSEEPGTGKGDKCSKYIYEVEKLKNGNKVYLRRPASLNKGVDFTVHIENIKFRAKGIVDMPSHNDIIEDLRLKLMENPYEYKKVKVIINKLYSCENISESEYSKVYFNDGHPIDGILKAIKWLFIEQDVTYWNWSGRAMLYNGLKENNLV